MMRFKGLFKKHLVSLNLLMFNVLLALIFGIPYVTISFLLVLKFIAFDIVLTQVICALLFSLFGLEKEIFKG